MTVKYVITEYTDGTHQLHKITTTGRWWNKKKVRVLLHSGSCGKAVLEAMECHIRENEKPIVKSHTLYDETGSREIW